MHPQDGRLTQRLTRSSGLGKQWWRELSWPSGQVPFSPQSFLCKRLSDLTKYELNQISCFNPVLHLPPLSISLFFSERQSQPFLYVWHVDGFHIQNQQLTCMLLYAKSYICLSFFLITPHFFWYCLWLTRVNITGLKPTLPDLLLPWCDWSEQGPQPVGGSGPE